MTRIFQCSKWMPVGLFLAASACNTAATNSPASTNPQPVGPGQQGQPLAANGAATQQPTAKARCEQLFASEQRNRGWAVDIEKNYGDLVASTGAVVVKPLRCKTTICMGTWEYRDRGQAKMAHVKRWRARQMVMQKNHGVPGWLPMHVATYEEPSTPPTVHQTYCLKWTTKEIESFGGSRPPSR